MSKSNVCIQLRGEMRWDSLDVKWGLTVAYVVQTNQWVEDNKQTHRDWTLYPQSHTHMVRGHEIKIVAVIGVEGHDVVDRFAGWQLQSPLIGQGHVRQEGQLRKRHQVRGHKLDCSTVGGSEENSACFLKLKLLKLLSCKIQWWTEHQKSLYLREDPCHQSTSSHPTVRDCMYKQELPDFKRYYYLLFQNIFICPSNIFLEAFCS